MNAVISICYYIGITWGIFALIHFLWVITVKNKSVEEGLELTHVRFNKL